MWARRGGPPDKPIILFDYDPSRSGAVAFRLLGNFNGFLQTDGYEGYTKVGARTGIVHVACLSHAKRPFDKALKAQKATGRGGLAAAGLALIQRIQSSGLDVAQTLVVGAVALELRSAGDAQRRRLSRIKRKMTCR
jgi:hypothetical protein